MSRFTYNEENFYTEWNDFLKGKIVIVAESKESVKWQLENDYITGTDFVCPTGDKEQPFCDYGDDTWWKYAYYDKEIDRAWKLKHGYKIDEVEND